MLSRLSDQDIEYRLDLVERMIATTKDPKDLPALNATFQKLIDEQVRREIVFVFKVREGERS